MEKGRWHGDIIIKTCKLYIPVFRNLGIIRIDILIRPTTHATWFVDIIFLRILIGQLFLIWKSFRGFRHISGKLSEIGYSLKVQMVLLCKNGVGNEKMDFLFVNRTIFSQTDFIIFKKFISSGSDLLSNKLILR